jgi:hypothetical protein
MLPESVMSSPIPSQIRFAKFLVFANILFWLIVGIFFALKSTPYQPHKLLFEERTPT